MLPKNHSYCIILAGGNGSRFWPLSRNDKPKQFIDFFGAGRSLLQQTFDRMSQIVPPTNIFVTTNPSYTSLVKEQLPEMEESNILSEPAPRNTAVCVAWASSSIKAIDPEASIIISPCDQMIVRESEFIKTMTEGLDFVSKTGNILTIAIKPTRPETAYGYIQGSEDETFNNGRIMKAKSFTEKPEVEFAQIFFESGEFYWNTGLFVWNVKTAFNAFKALLPDIGNGADDELDSSAPDYEKLIIEKNYTTCPSLPIDRGILEKANNVYVLPAEFGWIDMGTWQSYYDALPKDTDGNAQTKAQTIMCNSTNNIVSLPEGHSAIISGLSGYVVVESHNMLLICKKEEASNMRRFASEAQMKFGEEVM